MSRRRRGLRNFVGSIVALGVLGVVAILTHEPFVFPSLGPTAFLIFDVPNNPPAWPKNAFFGHLIGALAGFFALAVTGLLDVPSNAPSYVVAGMTPERAVAASLSLGLSGALMAWFGVPHPPACATTLIVSLGILHRPDQLLVLMVAVVALLAEGVVLNRIDGVDYPIWTKAATTPSPTQTASAAGSGGTGNGSGSA